MKKITVGIIGSGFIAQQRHIPSFQKLRKQVKVTAVCDINETIASTVAKRFRIPNSYSSISNMVSKEELDIVDICTPPQTHKSVAVEVLERNCHVLTEKPMAVSLSDCDDMISAAKKNQVKLSVVHNQRFYPPFIKAQELIKKGVIGELTGLRILILTNKNMYMVHEGHWVHKLPVGVIEETGPHAIYMSLPFMEKVEEVSVKAKKIQNLPWVLYDDYRVELVGHKLNSSIMISHANNCTATDMEFIGSEGVIRTDMQSMITTIYRRRDYKPRSLAFSSLGMAGSTIKGVTANFFKTVSGYSFLGHDIMIKQFVESVINDTPPPVPPEEGRETIRILEMIADQLT